MKKERFFRGYFYIFYDENENPVQIAESSKQLAEFFGKTIYQAHKMVYRNLHGISQWIHCNGKRLKVYKIMEQSDE